MEVTLNANSVPTQRFDVTQGAFNPDLQHELVGLHDVMKARHGEGLMRFHRHPSGVTIHWYRQSFNGNNKPHAVGMFRPAGVSTKKAIRYLWRFFAVELKY